MVVGFWAKKKCPPPLDSDPHQKLLTPPLLKLIIQGVYNLDRLLGGGGSNRLATAATLLLDRATMAAATDICGARKYKTKINTHEHTHTHTHAHFYIYIERKKNTK